MRINMNFGSYVRHLVNAVEARLQGNLDTAKEWQTIARQLRTAADKARKVAKLAEAMEDYQRPTATWVADVTQAYTAFDINPD